MYRVEQLIDNYREEELAEGALLALSKPFPLEQKKIKNGDARTVLLQAVFKENSRYNQTSTEVLLDDTHGDLLESYCDCADFEQDTYACKHTIALQTLWLEKTYGRKELENSPLKQILVKKTGIPNPFIPGVLRETTGNIKKILKNNLNIQFQNQESSSSVPYGKLHLEVHLLEYENKTVELKVGEKRCYVVKDANEFFRAFDSHRELSFGKNLRFPAYREAFHESSKKRLDFLLNLHKDSKEDRVRTLYYGGYANNNLRYLHLTSTEFDLLMEQVGPEGIYIGERILARFTDQKYKPEMQIKKQEYGALVEFAPFTRIAQTALWDYLLTDNKIYRVSRDVDGKLDEMLQLASQEEEIFISEKDLPILCQQMLPQLLPVMEVQGIGVDLEQYLPPKPVFQWYLDHPQDDMISCKALACYSDETYPLARKWKENQQRNQEEERQMLATVRQIFHAYEEESESFFYQGDDGEIYYFLTELLPRLETLGEVFISDKLKKLRVRPMTKVDVGVAIDSGMLLLDLSSDAFTQDELTEILSSYKRKKKYYKLKNGSFIRMDEELEAVWQALSECIRGLRKPKDGEWKLPLFRAMYLDEMLKERDCIDYDRSREYRRLLGRMRDAENNVYEPPKSLQSILRGYQTDGFRWLKTLKDSGFGGILADDMGLGKTLQVLAFLLSEKESGKNIEEMRTLIVTPASLLYNWKQEIEKYTPELTVTLIVGTAQERQNMIQQTAKNAEIWITSYDLLKRDIQWYEGISFANEILDEAQYIKNQTTNAAKSVRLIQSGFRMALTGTPIENRLSELWSIFDYLMPGFLYSYSRFREEIEMPVVHDGESEAMEKLRKMVHPFVLRRLKKEVLKELPDKLEEEVSVSMDGEQRQLYDAHAQRLKMYLEKQTPEEFAHGKLEILAELTKLRQLCCGPELLVEQYQGENAKLETCIELLHQAIAGGHKVLLFSQFTTMLDEIGKRLKKEEIAYHRIDGSVSKEERMRSVDAFQRDDTPVFCISLKAGGTGLNLTAADIVIHYDPWWNIAAQNQATDRTHRIGQKNVVTVYQLIAAGTIEEKIVKLQKSKYQLAQDVLSGDGISSIMIDREQVLSLLD